MDPALPPIRSAHDRRRLVTAIHDTATMLVLVVAGGGNAVIADLLDVGGASRTVLEVLVPYAPSAMADLVGPAPADRPIVSPDQAEVMALAALDRARSLVVDDDTPVIGVAVTAALASDRPKRGDHRAHVAVAVGNTATSVEHRQIDLVKGERDRSGEDRVVADAVLDVVATACGLG